MNYPETLKYLFNTLPMFQRIGGAAYKANLDNGLELDAYFGHQHTQYKTIHIAGTNGKGSVSHMLAATLQQAGYKTGLYTSPHILDFRERIKVNGEKISEKFIVNFIEKHKQIFTETQSSFFEMTVFMAFAYFALVKVDFAIIEVGLGGRLDTTNVIDPELSIITNIGLDHTQFLGDTLPLIAQEKAGIIKKNTPVIIGETQIEIKELFEEKAQQLNSSISFADEHIQIDYPMKNLDDTVTWHFKTCSDWPCKELTIDLPGIYQQKNLPPVLMALEQLIKSGIKINLDAISEGLRNVKKLTSLLGRWQIIDHNPLTICDIAHNKEGFRYILEQLDSTPYKRLHMVLGFVNDKNLAPIIKSLPKSAIYYLCQPDIPRALKVEELTELFETEGYRFAKFNSVSTAYTEARVSAEKNDLIFIGGSTFVVADFLKWRKAKH